MTEQVTLADGEAYVAAKRDNVTADFAFNPTDVAFSLIQLYKASQDAQEQWPHSEKVSFVEETMLHLGFVHLDNDCTVWGCTTESIIDLLRAYGAWGHLMENRTVGMAHFDEAEKLLETRLDGLRQARREWINRNNLNK